MFRLFVNVSLKELRLRPMRTALMLGGIAIGVSMVTAIDLLNRSVIEHFNASIMAAAGETELQVVAPGGERRIDADTAFAVAAVDGVYAALPVIDAGVPRSSSDEVIRVFATDFTDPRATSSYGVTIHGDLDPLELLNDPKAALVSERTARRLSLSRGAPLSLAAATGPREFRVAGILETRGPLGASGEDFLVMDIMAAQALLGIDGQVDRIDVVPETDQDLEALAATIRSRVDPALEVVTPYGRGRYFAEAVSAFQTMIFSLSLLALLTGVFIVYSAVSTSTVTRQRAIGTLRAVGVRPGEVVTLFAIEAAACGLLASLVGSLLGALLARVLADQATGTIGVIFQLRAGLGSLGLGPQVLARSLLIGTFSSVAATLPPALKVASAQPLEAMTARPGIPVGGSENPPRVFLFSSLVLVLVTVLAIAAELRWRSIVFGNLASTSWFVAFIFFSVPAIAWLSMRLSPGLERVFGLAGRIAAENLLRSSRRSAVAVSALALSLATTLTFAGLFRSFEQSLVEYVENFMNGDFSVSSIHTRGGWLEEPIDSSLASVLAAVEGVERVETMRLLTGFRFRDRRVGLLALSDGFLTEEQYGPWFVEGEPATALARVRRGEAVLISENLARLSGVVSGEMVSLGTASGSLRLPVAGVVIDYTSDQGSIVLASSLYADAWRDPLVNRLHVFASQAASPTLVRAEIRRKLGGSSDLKVLSLADLVDYHRFHVARAFDLASSLELLMIIVTFAGIVDVLVSSVNDRRRELGLMSVVGAGRNTLRTVVMIESGVMVLAGLLLGLVGGLVSSWMWVHFHWTYLLGWILGFHFPWWSAARAAVLAVAVATLATWGPAKAAAAMNPLEALRQD